MCKHDINVCVGLTYMAITLSMQADVYRKKSTYRQTDRRMKTNRNRDSQGSN